MGRVERMEETIINEKEEKTLEETEKHLREIEKNIVGLREEVRELKYSISCIFGRLEKIEP